MFLKKLLLTSLAAVATLGVLSTAACSSPVSASLDDDMAAVGTDKATQVHMTIANNTGETLNLTASQSSGKDNHWQNRPAATLAPGQSTTASNYAAGDAEIDLEYQGASSNARFGLLGFTPLAGDNSATGVVNNPSYQVDAKNASGYNPTFTYSMHPGHTFNYTGQTDTYTVPPGITQLNVTAIGGLGSSSSAAGIVNSAQVTGTLAVTPGEVLTVGVAGNAFQKEYDNVTAGWGMTVNGESYSGGTGAMGPNGESYGPSAGGGATVLVDGSGTVAVVAGGGGGRGEGVAGDQHSGGRGGYPAGNWTGENGMGNGGKAGGAFGTQGESVDSGADGSGGAGGGGVHGGAAGIDGGGAGGGAGSSGAPGLTNASVKPSGNHQLGAQLVISPAS